MLRCSACPISATPFITVEELEVHIAADHVNYVPYECEKCRFSKFPTEFALVSHCMNDHGLKEFYVGILLKEQDFPFFYFRQLYNLKTAHNL